MAVSANPSTDCMRFFCEGKQIEVEPRIKRPLALGRRAFLLGVFHFNDFNQVETRQDGAW